MKNNLSIWVGVLFLSLLGCRGPAEIQGTFEDVAQHFKMDISGETIHISYQGTEFEFPDFQSGFAPVYNQLKRKGPSVGVLSPALSFHGFRNPLLPHIETEESSDGEVGDVIPGLFDIYLVGAPRSVEFPRTAPILESYVAEVFYFEFQKLETGQIDAIEIKHSVDGVVNTGNLEIKRYWQILWDMKNADEIKAVRVR
ncbi:MAG: hypothetical protein AABZ55_10995 [Bdellovibrionota bacterium]